MASSPPMPRLVGEPGRNRRIGRDPTTARITPGLVRWLRMSRDLGRSPARRRRVTASDGPRAWRKPASRYSPRGPHTTPWGCSPRRSPADWTATPRRAGSRRPGCRVARARAGAARDVTHALGAEALPQAVEVGPGAEPVEDLERRELRRRVTFGQGAGALVRAAEPLPRRRRPGASRPRSAARTGARRRRARARARRRAAARRRARPCATRADAGARAPTPRAPRRRARAGSPASHAASARAARTGPRRWSVCVPLGQLERLVERRRRAWIAAARAQPPERDQRHDPADRRRVRVLEHRVARASPASAQRPWYRRVSASHACM